MRRRGAWLILLGVVLMVASCKEEQPTGSQLQRADMDLTQDPGMNYYQYANGGWISRTTLPAEKTRYGVFDQLREQSEDYVHGLLTKAMERKGDTTDAEWLKIGDFYASGMDSVRRNAQGYHPLENDFAMIAQITTPEQVVSEVARERPLGGDSPFYLAVEQDNKKSDEMTLSLYQSGLGMPDRDYYTDTTERAKTIQQSYVKMLESLLLTLGKDASQAQAVAQDVYNLEKHLAEGMYTRVQMRDPNLVYNKLTFAELKKLTPNINWELYFQNLGVNLPETMIVDNPDYFKRVSQALVEVPINIWKDYLTLRFFTDYASSLSDAIDSIQFEFYGKTLSGQQVQKPRWRRIASTVQRYLGEAVGKIYVAEKFTPEAKTKMLDLVEHLRTAYAQRLEKLGWMSDSTKKKALEKLAAINVKIGYPDKWKDYTDLVVSRDSFVQNIRNGMMFRFNEQIAKLGKPVDRGEWFIYPQTVNAYYSPTMNEIVFPAGILQPPFFDPNIDDAVNYGAIGVVIGHEITHGFDDQGRLFSKEGNLENWWTEEDAARFTAQTELLVNQYNAFEPLPGYHIDGKLTLGENLADYGGLTISLQAYKLAAAEKTARGQQAEAVDGFTPMERFFLSYAKVWRNLSTKEDLQRRLKEDVHSPGEYRVNGAMYDIPEFYETYNVSTESPFYRAPEQRPSIW